MDCQLTASHALSSARALLLQQAAAASAQQSSSAFALRSNRQPGRLANSSSSRRHVGRLAHSVVAASAVELSNADLETPDTSAADGSAPVESRRLSRWTRVGATRWRPGGGGRRRVRSLKPVEKEGEEEEGAEESVGESGAEAEGASTKQLTWLQTDSLDLTTERTISRVNRTIARCGSVKEALAVVEEMKAAGLNAANEGTYVALITVCRRQRQFERALVVYEAMKQAGVAPGMLTFNTLISCCQQAQKLEDAYRLKRDMEALGLKPDVVTYTSLMALVVRTGPYRGRSSPPQRFAKAMELFREMQEKGVAADAITFNTLLFAGAQAKLPGKVLEVYGMMVAAGVPPNQFTFGILLEAVGHGGRLKAALQVFNEMKASGIQPSATTYNFLIEACSTAPQPDAERAWALYEEMERGNVRANAETFSHLITACCKAEDADKALEAFDMARARGLTRVVNTAAYNKLMHCAAVAGRTEKAFELYGQMRTDGHQPDVVTFGTLISACANDADVARAIATWQELESMGIRANQATYHALIGLYGKAGQWEKSLETFHSMKAECKNEPETMGSYSIVIDALFGAEGADAVVSQLAQNGGRLQLSKPVAAAVEVYREGVEAGVLRRPSADVARCDIRNMTRATAIAAIIDWLQRLKPPTHTQASNSESDDVATASSPTSSGSSTTALAATAAAAADPVSSIGDLVLVTGTISKSQKVGEPRGRFPKLFTSANRTLRALGLKPKVLRTLTFQALALEGTQLERWSWDGQHSAEQVASAPVIAAP